MAGFLLSLILAAFFLGLGISIGYWVGFKKGKNLAYRRTTSIIVRVKGAESRKV
jgi:hypothetical protein